MYKQIDVSSKPVVYREAKAEGRIKLKRETIKLIKEKKIEKGDPVSLASLSAINAAKLTSQLMILCHPLRIEKVEPEIKIEDNSIVVSVSVSTHEKTGVEMEALTAVSVALLNIWDAVKKYEKDKDGQYPETSIQDIHVVRKVKDSGL